MDTHDVSGESQYVEVMLKQKEILRDAQALKGQHPRQRKSRDQHIMEFMFQHEMCKKQPNTIRPSFVPPSYLPCVSPLKGLSKIMLKNQVLETHHRDTYICLRVVIPPYRITAVMAIAEDEERNVVTLQLYNQGRSRSITEIIDEGTVLIVKEPYLKVTSDENYGLRVDHVSDIMLIPEYDKKIPSVWQKRLTSDVSAQGWKMRGNDLFNKLSHRQAMECYSRALESSPTDDEAHLINLNRALILLKTNRFDAALLQVKDATSEKGLFRKAQALYYLQRFRECCDVHKLLCRDYPENLAAKIGFTRAINRLSEQENKKYLFRQMQVEAMKRHPPHLDNATYIGPVAVKNTTCRGRGLFTTTAVKAGDLLFCEKAFAHASVDTNDGKNNMSFLINTERNVMTMGGQAELAELIVQKLYNNPSLMPIIIDLHHGSYTSVKVSNIDEMPVVDTFLVERIMSLNCFGCPVSSREVHKVFMKGKKRHSDEKYYSCGLWPMASYINHSCYNNAYRTFIGNMMVARATQYLEPDTEILIWYRPPFPEASNTGPKEFQHWGFKCSCAICLEFKTAGAVIQAKRNQLRADVEKTLHSRTQRNLAKIETTLSMLRDTYHRPAVEVPRLSLWDLQLGLSHIHAAQNRPHKAILWALQALESLGFVIDGGTIPLETDTQKQKKKAVDSILKAVESAGFIFESVAIVTDEIKPLVVKKWGLMDDQLVLIEKWHLNWRHKHSATPRPLIGFASVKMRRSMRRIQ